MLQNVSKKPVRDPFQRVEVPPKPTKKTPMKADSVEVVGPEGQRDPFRPLNLGKEVAASAEDASVPAVLDAASARAAAETIAQIRGVELDLIVYKDSGGKMRGLLQPGSGAMSGVEIQDLPVADLLERMQGVPQEGRAAALVRVDGGRYVVDLVGSDTKAQGTLDAAGNVIIRNLRK